MKATQIHSYGDGDVLLYEVVADSQAGPGEVVIRVTAAAVNPLDWTIRIGAAAVAGELVQPIVHRLPLMEAREAHAYGQKGGTGEILLGV